MTLLKKSKIVRDVSRLEVDEIGQSNNLQIGDKFVFVSGPDKREHTITNNLESHFEYDGNPSRKLSKGEIVKRVGQHDSGERRGRTLDSLSSAIKTLNKTGDVASWMNAMSDVLSRVLSIGMKEVVLDLEKLEKLGTVLFSKSAGKNNKMAIDTLDPKSRKEWIRAVESATKMVEDSIVAESTLRNLVQKIITSCR